MVAAGVLVDLGRTAKLRGEHHERRAKEAAGLEVLEQGRHGGVEFADLPGQVLPQVAVHVPAPHLHLHAADATLDEPPREQAALAETRTAISFAGLVVLAGDVEGGEVAAAHQANGIGIHPVVGLDLPAGIPLLEVVVDPVGERQPSLEVCLRQVARAGDVLQATRGIGERHRRDGGVEKAAAWVLVAIAHEHVARQVAAPLAERVHGPRAERRMTDAVELRVTRPHEVGALLVGPGLGGERADDGEPVGEPGQPRQVLAEPDARKLRGDRTGLPLLLAAGFRIEGVDVAHRSTHHQRDHVHAAGGRVGCGRCSPCDGFQERETKRGPRGIAKERAAGEPVIADRG